VLLLKDKYKRTLWYIAAEFGDIELLVTMWDWAKELRLKPEDLRNAMLSKDKFKHTVWHKAAYMVHVEILVMCGFGLKTFR
jgi:hypothetical protein